VDKLFKDRLSSLRANTPVKVQGSRVYSILQLAEAKKKADENQMEVEDTQGAKRKLDMELKAQQDHNEAMQAENNKLLKSKKKIQEEVKRMSDYGCGFELSLSICSLMMSWSTLRLLVAI
jgi:chromosome segregation ATPase